MSHASLRRGHRPCPLVGARTSLALGLALLSLGACAPKGRDAQANAGSGAGATPPASSPTAPAAASLPASPSPYPAVVAGAFYPAEPAALAASVSVALDEASPAPLPEPLLGLLLPHAGHRYSGAVAAAGYRALRERQARAPLRLVVLLAPSHRVAAPYAATLGRPAYRTPLGDQPLAMTDSQALIEAAPAVLRPDERLFDQEHSLEVQLPFLQQALPGVPVLPIVMGEPSLRLAQALASALQDRFGAARDVLFLASSDLSHFEDRPICRARDERTLGLLATLGPADFAAAAQRGEAQLCGRGPALVLLELQRRAGGGPVQRLAYGDSADAGGDPHRVVGYGALAFGIGGAAGAAQAGGYTLSDAERAFLLRLARETVERWVRERRVPDLAPPAGPCSQPGAAFVTLRKQGRLRGCIGHTVAREPLWRCVRAVARAAASEDPRFQPVQPQELAELTYEVSVLTPLEPLEQPLDLRLGVDGLMLHSGPHRGLLLPQVPGEFGWNEEQFLDATCRKAGLAPACWRAPEVRLERFQALVF